MSLIQQIINKAMVFAWTRSGATSSSLIQSKEFRDLFDTVSRLNAQELEYHPEELFQNRHGEHWAPCSYTEIFDNEHVTASVFTVRHNREIPLHDHPTMFGLLKVIQGRVRIQSYSYLTPNQRLQMQEELNTKNDGRRIGKFFKQSVNRFEEKNVMPVIHHTERILGVDDPPAVLTPTEHNIHRVQAIDDQAAFFDILTPPYIPAVPSRDCHYFQPLEPKESLQVTQVQSAVADFRLHVLENGQNSISVDQNGQKQNSVDQDHQSKINIGWLMRVPPPKTYFCATIDYRGPAIRSMSENEVKEEAKKTHMNN